MQQNLGIEKARLDKHSKLKFYAAPIAAASNSKLKQTNMEDNVSSTKEETMKDKAIARSYSIQKLKREKS